MWKDRAELMRGDHCHEVRVRWTVCIWCVVSWTPLAIANDYVVDHLIVTPGDAATHILATLTTEQSPSSNSTLSGEDYSEIPVVVFLSGGYDDAEIG